MFVVVVALVKSINMFVAKLSETVGCLDRLNSDADRGSLLKTS